MVKKKLIALTAFVLLLMMLFSFLTVSLTPFKVSASAEAEKVAERFNAKSALIMDYNTGEILFSQNPDEKLPIASMVKIMTLNLIFEALENGKIALEDKVNVSHNASSMGGSQAFLDANLSYSVDELIKSVIVASANDSCVALAEHLMGSVEQFVVKMNEKAQEFNMSNTNFVNCTGLPESGQYCTASDAALMFRQLINHKKFFDYSKVWMYDIAHPDGRSTTLTNTNKLVRFYDGCDGGKTGFTKEALSCLAATAKKGDTRLISVVIGAPSAKERNAEVSKMFNYGFANFVTKEVISDNTEINLFADIDGGKEKNVALKVEKSFYQLVKKGEKPQFEYSFEVQNGKAPVKKGDVLGKVLITMNGQQIGEVNLVSTSDVNKATYLDIVNRLIANW